MNAYKNEVLEMATNCHKLGWSIIPVGSDKKPLISWKAYQTQRATLEQIETWAKQYPNMGIAVVTGEISGIVVVDIEKDGSAKGYPHTVTANSGGGGWHLYYRYPTGKKIGRYIKLRPSTDVSGNGGYVVLPPSLHPSGNRYAWALQPGDADLAELPADLVQEIEADTHKTLSPTATASGEKTLEGSRNDDATKYIGRLLHYLPQELWEDAAWPAIKHRNQTQYAKPLPDGELRTTFNSISSKEASQRPVGEKKVFGYKTQTLAELYEETFPEETWLVDGLIPFSGLTALTGEPKSFKSYLSQNLAIAIATGNPFLGKFPVTKGRVLLIDEENPRRYNRTRFKEMGMPRTDDISFISRASVRFDEPESVKALLKIVEEMQPRLIVVDSLTKTHGKNENRSFEMSIVFDGLKKLTSDDRAIVLIHHHRKSYGEQKRGDGQSIRGSSNIFAELDAHLAVDRTDKHDVIVTQGALRIGEEIKPFKASLVRDEDGVQSFVYQGDVDDKKAAHEKAVSAVRELFTSQEVELSVQDCVDWTELPDRDVRKALKTLEDSKILVHHNGAKGKHIYKFATRVENSAAPASE